MTIRKQNQEKMAFWSEFCADLMVELKGRGFSSTEAISLISAIIGGKELVWTAPPGYVADPDSSMH